MSWTVTILKAGEDSTNYGKSMDNEIDPAKLQNSADPIIIHEDGSVEEACDPKNITITEKEKIFRPFNLLFPEEEIDKLNDVVKSDMFNKDLTTANGKVLFEPEYKITDYQVKQENGGLKSFVQPNDPISVNIQVCSGKYVGSGDWKIKQEVDKIIDTGKGSISDESKLSIINRRLLTSSSSKSVGTSLLEAANGLDIDSKTEFWAKAWHLGYLHTGCGGCGTLVGALPPQGTPPTKRTSLAYSANFDIQPNTGCESFLSGVISADDPNQNPCTAGVGSVFRCYDAYGDICRGDQFCYGTTMYAQIMIGKYRKEIQNVDGSCLGTIAAEVLVPDPEAPCAYWFNLVAAEGYGAQGWSTSYNGFTGPILPENIIGSHSLECTVAAGVLELDEDGVFQCGDASTFQRSATITIS